MKQSFQHLRKDNVGQSLAEFALIFPIILVLCMAIMQLALIANAQTVFNYAIYAATRSGVVQEEPEDEDNLEEVAGLVMMPLDPLALAKVEITEARRQGNVLEVEGVYHYRLIIPVASGILKLLDWDVRTDLWTFLGSPHIPLYSRNAMVIESPGPAR